MFKILFFEDFPYASENELFRMNLRDELGEESIQTVEEKTVTAFEDRIRGEDFDVIILDVMAQAPKSWTWTGTNDPVPSSLTGVELLRRCRRGVYPDRYKKVPVFMRTARGETYVQQLCTREGANGYFKAGAEDAALVQEIRDRFSRPSAR